MSDSIPQVTICPVIKNPRNKSPRAIWVILEDKKILGSGRTQSEAIHKVEEEGWILLPYNYEAHPTKSDLRGGYYA